MSDWAEYLRSISDAAIDVCEQLIFMVGYVTIVTLVLLGLAKCGGGG